MQKSIIQADRKYASYAGGTATGIRWNAIISFLEAQTGSTPMKMALWFGCVAIGATGTVRTQYTRTHSRTDSLSERHRMYGSGKRERKA